MERPIPGTNIEQPATNENIQILNQQHGYNRLGRAGANSSLELDFLVNSNSGINFAFSNLIEIELELLSGIAFHVIEIRYKVLHILF